MKINGLLQYNHYSYPTEVPSLSKEAQPSLDWSNYIVMMISVPIGANTTINQQKYQTNMRQQKLCHSSSNHLSGSIFSQRIFQFMNTRMVIIIVPSSTLYYCFSQIIWTILKNTVSISQICNNYCFSYLIQITCNCAWSTSHKYYSLIISMLSSTLYLVRLTFVCLVKYWLVMVDIP